jgi:predicted TIM-barrel fold metal-dependent hydrolase
MNAKGASHAAEVRAQLDHPIIDADGHFVEILPLLHDEILSYVEEAGGVELRDRYLRSGVAPTDTSTILMDRDDAKVRAAWRAMPSWWGWQCENTLDRATCHLPALLYERLDEIGIDFMLAYPSMVLSYLDILDPELAQVLCRATNRYFARQFAPFADRITAGGIIPMHDPIRATEELEYAVRELGLKTVVISGYARRPIGRAVQADPALASVAYRLDTFGIDSEHDYDPFWARCVELGVAPVSHSAHQYHRVSRSVSNYVFNHVGGLATSHESTCKSLFLGGVTNRFPQLRVGFLEGGVAWAVSLYADLLGHWEKRNAGAITALDPDRLDVPGLMAYVARYGDDAASRELERIRDFFARPAARPAVLDEFAAVGIERPEDLRDKFVPNFYFGCEADDPLVAWAFNEKVNPLGARLRPIFGSDVAHWDVPDFREPVAEAWELVERGILTEAEFREFTFVNPARLHAGANPDFFGGTVVEGEVADAAARGELA